MQLRTILVILQHRKATQKWSVSAISSIPAEAIFVHKEYCLGGVFLTAFVWNSSKMLSTIAKSFSAGKSGSNFKACQGPYRSLMRLKNPNIQSPTTMPQVWDTDMLKFVTPKAPHNTKIHPIPFCFYFFKPSLQFSPVHRREDLQVKNSQNISKQF